jgi:hypothetical protein
MLGASTISLAFFDRDPTTCMQPRSRSERCAAGCAVM